MKWLTGHRTNQNEGSKCTTSAAIEGLTSVHLRHRSTRSHKAQTHQHLTCVSEPSAAHTAPASARMLFITTSYSLKFPSGSKISHVLALCILVRRGGCSLVRWKETVGVQWESGGGLKRQIATSKGLICYRGDGNASVKWVLTEWTLNLLLQQRLMGSSLRVQLPLDFIMALLEDRNSGPIQQNLARPPHR